MNWNLFIISVLAFILFALLSSNSSGRANFSSNGNTRAPCETGQTCQSCHLGGFFAPVTEDFKLIDPFTENEVFSYTPGKLYNAELKINASGFPNAYGFQATVLDTNNTEAGEWMNFPNNIQLSEADINCSSGTRNYIEHNAPFFLSTFRLDWQAPLCDIGPITFYYIGNAVNNDGSVSGDNAGNGGSTTYEAFLPGVVVIDSSEIPSGTYLSESGIIISGLVADSAVITLGGPDSININSPFTFNQGSELLITNQNCLE